MWARTLLLAALAVTASSLPGVVATSHAQPLLQQGYVILAQGQGRNAGGERLNMLSVREVIDIVRSRFGGQAMGAPRLEQMGGRSFYVLSWRFPDEVVREVRVDASTGQVL